MAVVAAAAVVAAVWLFLASSGEAENL